MSLDVLKVAIFGNKIVHELQLVLGFDGLAFSFANNIFSESVFQPETDNLVLEVLSIYSCCRLSKTELDSSSNSFQTGSRIS